jgi:hypothetical protein
MANPPPPYADITGISRTVMKDNAQESLANYDGNARPAEFTVDQTTSNVYIGNASGNLTQVWSPNTAIFPVYTTAQAANLSGAVGQAICVSNSAQGSDPDGMLAFWDATNNRWSYVYNNQAV